MADRQRPTLRMRRTFPAPRPLVFAHFVEPELLATWWGPEGTTMEGGEADLRVGGRFRWRMRRSTGQPTLLSGTFEAFDPPERLVMTHRWQGADETTRVTLAFVERGAETEVVLTHEGIADGAMVRRYEGGWSLPLARLHDRLAAGGSARKILDTGVGGR